MTTYPPNWQGELMKCAEELIHRVEDAKVHLGEQRSPVYGRLSYRI